MIRRFRASTAPVIRKAPHQDRQHGVLRKVRVKGFHVGRHFLRRFGMPSSIHDETVATLEQMLATFKERNLLYGENYLTLGQVMTALFPNGVTLNTPEDFIRFHFIDWMVGKMTRFVRTGCNHEDSILDASVYGAMLTAFTKVHNHDNQEQRLSGSPQQPS